ncbi:MAG: nuclear transport factor 2 family protein [Pseudomonadales bacterium]|jgi:hypothetical protein
MDANDIRQFIEALNRCWLEGDAAALARFYHPDVALLPPDMGPLIRGRDAVVASYREFLDTAELKHFEPVQVDVYAYPSDGGGTHMVQMIFEVDYVLDGSRYLEKGMEIYTVVTGADNPQIIWRQQVVLDSRIAGKSGAD